MTLQQLKYVTTVAQTGTISDAAKKLFISQPSLTKAVRELEKEMGITIFERTNRGIVISPLICFFFQTHRLWKDGFSLLQFQSSCTKIITCMEYNLVSNAFALFQELIFFFSF